jgi:hypothetical protein
MFGLESQFIIRDLFRRLRGAKNLKESRGFRLERRPIDGDRTQANRKHQRAGNPG